MSVDVCTHECHKLIIISLACLDMGLNGFSI